MYLNADEVQVKFTRSVVPVVFYHRGRRQIANRMATTCSLENKEGSVLGSATVRQHYRDPYNRRLANEKAFHKLADGFEPEVKKSLLSQFFTRYK